MSESVSASKTVLLLGLKVSVVVTVVGNDFLKEFLTFGPFGDCSTFSTVVSTFRVCEVFLRPGLAFLGDGVGIARRYLSSEVSLLAGLLLLLRGTKPGAGAVFFGI